ncbi:unnamed protein product, partial [Heterosigma akashiwo]
DAYLFAVGWFESLLVYIEAVPVATLTRVWALWVAERSFRIFHQVIIAILSGIEEDLLKMDLEDIMEHLQ